MKARRTWTALAACALVLGVTGVAHAGKPGADSDAAHAYDAGAKAFLAKDHASAVKSFLTADALSPSDASMEMALRAAEASGDPMLVLQVGARAREGDRERELGASLRERVASAVDNAKREVGEVDVQCQPRTRDGTCEYRVDGAEWRPDARITLRPGSHSLQVRSGGAVRVGSVTVSSGEHKTVTLSFTPRVEPQAPKQTEEAPLSKVWFYVGAGATVVAGGFTGWSALDTKSLHDQWQQTHDETLRSEAMDAQTRTNVAFVVTLCLAAATGVLAYFSKPWSF
jgi:hypothetical protein